MIQVYSDVTTCREELPLETERLMLVVTLFLQTSFAYHVSNIRVIDLGSWSKDDVEAYQM